MTFTTAIALPACNKIMHVKSITNKMHENLQKFLLEGDDELIEQSFENIVATCTQCNDNELCNMDKFILLCKIRSISYSSTVNLVNAENATINIDLEHIIEQLQNIKLAPCTSNLDAMSITFDLPHQLFLKHEEILINCIHCINDLHMHSLSKQNRDKILNVLNSKILADAAEYIVQTSKKFDETYFIPDVESLKFNSFKINPFNQSLFEILKIIYKEDLLNFYKTKYLCLTKLHMSCSDYDELAPADARLFLSFYNEEIAQQNESLKKSNNALSTITNE